MITLSMIDAAMLDRHALCVQVFADQIDLHESSVHDMPYADFARIFASPARGLVRVYRRDDDEIEIGYGWCGWELDGALGRARDAARRARGSQWPRWLIAASAISVLRSVTPLALKGGQLVALPNEFSAQVLSTMGP